MFKHLAPTSRPRLVFILSRLAGCLSRLARKQVISGQSKWPTVHPFHQRRPVQSNGAVIRYLHSDGMNEMMLCMLNYTNFLFATLIQFIIQAIKQNHVTCVCDGHAYTQSVSVWVQARVGCQGHKLLL